MNSERRKITAVIPAFNEERYICDVIKQTNGYVDEVIVVDDGSTDRTAELAENCGAVLIRLSRNMGAGYATRKGCDRAAHSADIIVTLDADGQHNPENIGKIIRPIIHSDTDIIYGVRARNRRMPFSKRVGNIILQIMANLLFGSRVVDTLTGFHAFRADSYRKIRWRSHGYGMVSEIIYRTMKNRLKYSQIRVETIYNGKTTGMNYWHGLQSMVLMLMWKLHDLFERALQ